MVCHALFLFTDLVKRIDFDALENFWHEKHNHSHKTIFMPLAPPTCWLLDNPLEGMQGYIFYKWYIFYSTSWRSCRVAMAKISATEVNPTLPNYCL